MHKLLLLICLIHMGICTEAQPDKLKVSLKNGEALYPKVLKVKDPLFKKKYLLLDGDREMSLKEVDYYISEDGYYIVRDIRRQSEILKREQEGVLPVYSHSYYSHRNMMGPNGTMMPAGGMQTDYYYEKYRSLTSVNLNNLKVDLMDDPVSLKKLRAVENGRYAKIGCLILGGALVLGGLSKMVKEGNEAGPPYDDVQLKPNAALIGGGLIMVVPLFIFGNQQKKLLEVLSMYNAQPK